MDEIMVQMFQESKKNNKRIRYHEFQEQKPKQKIRIIAYEK